MNGVKIPSAVRRYAGFFASVGSARVAGTALAAATLLFLLRALGTETYGKWAFVLVAVGFVNLAANPGIATFAQQRVAARRERAAGLAADLFSLRLTLAVVVSTFLVVYALRLESDPVVRKLLLFYGVPSVLLASLASDYALNAMERFHSRSVQQILSQGVYAAAVFLWVRGPEDVYVVAGAALGSSLTASLFGWTRLWSSGFRIRWRVDLFAWKEMLTVGLFYGVSSLMSQLYTRAGHLLVRWWAGDSALGLYAAIVRLVEMIFSFLGIAYGLLMPRIALYSHDRAMLRRIARYAVVVMAFVGLPLAIGGSVAAASLIPWALGPEYADAVPLFQVMAWYFITNSLSTFFSGTVVYGLGHARDYFRSTVAGAATNPTGVGGEVRVLDGSTGALRFVRSWPVQPEGLCVSGDGWVVATNARGFVEIWDATTGVLRDSIAIPGETQTPAVLSEDGSYLVTGGFSRTVRLYHWNGTDYIADWENSIPNTSWVTALAISRDATTIVAGTWTNPTGGQVVVYDRTSPTPVWTDLSFGDAVQSVAVTPDGGKIAAASWGRLGGTLGNVISVYERSSAIPLWTIGDDAIAGVGSCMSVDLSENGRFLVAGGKAVHAREFGSGGFVIAIDVTSAAGIPDIGGVPALMVGPNPFRGSLWVKGAGPGVSIWSADGRLIRSLVGSQWDGRDDVGRDVPAGMYFVRGVAPGAARLRVVRMR